MNIWQLPFSWLSLFSRGHLHLWFTWKRSSVYYLLTWWIKTSWSLESQKTKKLSLNVVNVPKWSFSTLIQKAGSWCKYRSFPSPPFRPFLINYLAFWIFISFQMYSMVSSKNQCQHLNPYVFHWNLISSLIIRKICFTGSKKKKNAKPLSFKVGIGKVIRGVSKKWQWIKRFWHMLLVAWCHKELRLGMWWKQSLESDKLVLWSLTDMAQVLWVLVSPSIK